MKKFPTLSLVTLVAILGIALPTLPASADGSSGLEVSVFTYDGSESPDRSATYTSCESGVTHVDNIDIDYDEYFSSVVAGCREDAVIVHYTGFITFPDSGSYSFVALADDGFWMSLDGNAVITNDWVSKGRSGNTYSDVAIEGGRKYAFDAWYYEEGGGANVTLQYQLQGRDEGFITVPPAFFITAPTTLEVSFASEGGDEIEKAIYTVGADGLSLPTPVRDGYVFAGWAKGSVDGIIIDSETYVPLENVTLYALWAPVEEAAPLTTLADTGETSWPLAITALLLMALGLGLLKVSKKA